MKLPEEIQFIANARAPQKSTDARLDGRVCVITGATSGVGYRAALRLAEGGATLVMIARNEEKAVSVRDEIAANYGVPAEYEIADFSRLDEVRAAAERILQRHPQVHLLVNDAGVHCTRRTLTPDGNETAFGVNHLASFLLTQLFVDRLTACAPARIIQVNSEGHRFGGLDLDDITWERRRYRGIKGYGASKTAQLLTVWEFADRLEGSGVTINAVHPGAVKSAIGTNNGFIYRTYSKLMVQPLLKDPAIAANAIYYFAAAPEMANVSGRFFNLTTEEVPAAHARDRALGKRVWKLSVAAVAGAS